MQANGLQGPVKRLVSSETARSASLREQTNFTLAEERANQMALSGDWPAATTPELQEGHRWTGNGITMFRLRAQTPKHIKAKTRAVIYKKLNTCVGSEAQPSEL